VIIEVARELSLSLSFFSDVDGLDKLLGGHSRRFILLAERDISIEFADRLVLADRAAEFGLVVFADQEKLRASERAQAAKTLASHRNVEWLSPEYDSDTLSAGLRKCRRRMLRLGKGELEKAIMKREFVLQYQPKVERRDASEWKTHEVEALIRWQHPQHGLLSPLEFLPEAETFDLVGPISEFVLFEAAAQLLRWREQGLTLNACINLASSQLNNPKLAKNFERIVTEQGLQCTNFTFEVREQDIVNSQAPHLRVLNEMRQLGFRISLDDYGVVASSLSAFEQLPFDEIKIHAVALARAQESPVALKVLAAITGLAHNLGVSVCAEGVEDQATFEFLEAIGCDKMQGYLISEAVMPDIIRKAYFSSPGSVINVV